MKRKSGKKKEKNDGAQDAFNIAELVVEIPIEKKEEALQWALQRVKGSGMRVGAAVEIAGDLIEAAEFVLEFVPVANYAVKVIRRALDLHNHVENVKRLGKLLNIFRLDSDFIRSILDTTLKSDADFCITFSFILEDILCEMGKLDAFLSEGKDGMIYGKLIKKRLYQYVTINKTSKFLNEISMNIMGYTIDILQMFGDKNVEQLNVIEDMKKEMGKMEKEMEKMEKEMKEIVSRGGKNGCKKVIKSRYGIGRFCNNHAITYKTKEGREEKGDYCHRHIGEKPYGKGGCKHYMSLKERYCENKATKSVRKLKFCELHYKQYRRQ
uniref:Uncharacterized protein n=1 Tax=Aplanochytrium stocchinoi TaxID=215587 RepID=A0A7S3PIM1_9STRA|mmetsp:Transcript_30927/g.38183  ORF Transcript_30927/g.38183 Transcript_30927/m.38183 type:complete len:324 (+) Transcript_30927:224-1195(+)|eukprot:CAMPEP_0204839898 /NCGR_PEP_ID=MMETSP1346-20131115/35800_1 /ASSEMBLY_ACC=CAM_ASM_000771 /TAXON_ID=215587 /ORGANISM="Aplanochytrium stocchinoi, Strain GSBS06" /LENGTH=323 /DNA_ID=CAMNT_0051976967 /DNA_START=120 /DNA_END=1091 /DNA_ORIENTATION=+